MNVEFVVAKLVTGGDIPDYYLPVETINLGDGGMTVAAAKALYLAGGAWPFETEHGDKSEDYDVTYAGETIEEYVVFRSSTESSWMDKTRGPVAV